MEMLALGDKLEYYENYTTIINMNISIYIMDNVDCREISIVVMVLGIW